MFFKKNLKNWESKTKYFNYEIIKSVFNLVNNKKITTMNFFLYVHAYLQILY